MTTPRYTFRVNPKRYRDLYERLESIEEGERSWWVLEALLSKLAAEQGQGIELKAEPLAAAAIQPESIPYQSPSPIPAMTETAAVAETVETSEVETKLDQFARMF
jgi:hypothetical protein